MARIVHLLPMLLHGAMVSAFHSTGLPTFMKPHSPLMLFPKARQFTAAPAITLSVSTPTPLPPSSDNKHNRKKQHHVRTVVGEDFLPTVLQNSDKVVVVKFYARWCNACKALGKIYEKMARQHESDEVIFIELEFDPHRKLCKSLGINKLPFIQIYSRGVKAEAFACGPAKAPLLREKLALYIEQPQDLQEGI